MRANEYEEERNLNVMNGGIQKAFFFNVSSTKGLRNADGINQERTASAKL